MNRFEVVINQYNGSRGEEFLSSLSEVIDQKIEFEKKFNLCDWEVDESDVTSEVHTAIEQALCFVDNNQGLVLDMYVVSIFKNGDLMNKYLYHAFPFINEWLHVKLPNDLI